MTRFVNSCISFVRQLSRPVLRCIPQQQNLRPVVVAGRRISTLKVNQTRLWDTIHHTAQWGDSKDGGVKRLTLTDEDKAVRDWFVETAKSYGCTIKIDEVGTIFAIRPGRDNSRAPIGIGSHLDTQPAGGKYDGILGVQAGIEILKVLNESDYTTNAPLAVIDWTNEEGARFNTGMLASAVWSGMETLEHAYGLRDSDGKTFLEELERIGYRGSVPARHSANPLSAHFELHIEQGPVLEDTGKAIGVVTGVQGMGWLIVTVNGKCQHCGTTPMDRRADALLAASKMISRVNEIALEAGGMSTVGVINSEPQSPGTIPGKVVFSVDLEHLDNPTRDQMIQTTRNECARLAKEGSCEVEIEDIWASPGVRFDPQCIDCVREAAVELVGQDGYVELPAGAGHDSGGVSHHPSEYSSPEQCALGVQTLLGAVLRYDNRTI